jgi:hypothetical protein
MYCNSSDVKWIPYNKLHEANYTRVQYDHWQTSDIMIMRVNTIQNTYTWVTQLKWFQDKLALSKAIMDEHQANFAGTTHCTLKGLPSSINPDCPARNCKDAMSREDGQEWSETFDKEYREVKDQNAFKAVRLKPGVKSSRRPD